LSRIQLSGPAVRRLTDCPQAIADRVFLRGRATSSPPQFGQREDIAAAQSGQNVHS
jgi:hypothetical protein